MRDPETIKADIRYAKKEIEIYTKLRSVACQRYRDAHTRMLYKWIDTLEDLIRELNDVLHGKILKSISD